MSRKLTIKLTAILLTTIVKVIDAAQDLAGDMQKRSMRIGWDWVHSDAWKEKREELTADALRDLTRAVAAEIERETRGIPKGVEDE